MSSLIDIKTPGSIKKRKLLKDSIEQISSTSDCKPFKGSIPATQVCEMIEICLLSGPNWEEWSLKGISKMAEVLHVGDIST